MFGASPPSHTVYENCSVTLSGHASLPVHETVRILPVGSRHADGSYDRCNRDADVD